MRQETLTKRELNPLMVIHKLITMHILVSEAAALLMKTSLQCAHCPFDSLRRWPSSGAQGRDSPKPIAPVHGSPKQG